VHDGIIQVSETRCMEPHHAIEEGGCLITSCLLDGDTVHYVDDGSFVLLKGGRSWMARVLDNNSLELRVEYSSSDFHHRMVERVQVNWAEGKQMEREVAELKQRNVVLLMKLEDAVHAL